ncbi:MAG TPA: methyltransferase [Candidatus Saccharimonadales bacterium]|nr:methyltransferase [Candidatus Saccharimonadales bacterium]
MKSASNEIGNVVASPALVEMAMAYSRSRVLCAAARLGVADALGDSERSVEELAAACGADVQSLHRLLRTLASMGITAESAPGRFVLSPFGQPLRKDAPNSAWAGVVFWADLLADSWAHLTECVRSGRTAARIMADEGIVSRWSTAGDAGAIFREVMGTAPVERYAPIVKRWDFGSRRVVADLGGGGGALISAILSSHPQLNGILVDAPASIEAAKPRFEADGLGGRCELVGADLRNEVLTGADVYLLKHVLHGYDDPAALGILQKCRGAVNSDGCLLIIEFILPEVISAPDSKLQRRLLSDLNMLAVTGGKERSASEWSRLLQAASFRVGKIVAVEELDVSIIEAWPV